jgi:hypothetical protein
MELTKVTNSKVLKKLTFVDLVEKFPAFIESRKFVAPFSASRLCPETKESRPHHSIAFLYTHFNMILSSMGGGGRGNVIGWGTVLQAGRSRIRLPTCSFDFLNLPNPSSHNVGWLSPYQKWIPGIFLGSNALPIHKADNLTATCEADSLEKCGIIEVSQSYGLARLVTEIILLLRLLYYLCLDFACRVARY